MRKAVLPGLTLIMCVVVLIMFGCKIEPPTRVLIQNEWPRVYLVNVPPDSAQLPHAPIVYWYGADPDGYIIAYHWAIDDTSKWEVLDVDSVLGTEDTVAFSAPLPDTEFAHVFYVRAMDNDSAVTIPDSIPHRVFRVRNIPPVNTKFEDHPPDSLIPIPTVFIIEDTIATWEGVYFEWSTEDSDQVFPPKFSWSWDNGTWSAWDEATEKYFVGKDDPALMTTGQHTLRIRAMDDAMAIDSSATPFVMNVCVPTFERDLLVIDQTRNMSGGPIMPNDQEVDDFYKLVLDNAGWSGFDTLENSNDGDVHHCDIGPYKMVLLHSDDVSPAAVTWLTQDALGGYLDVGGRLFLGGYGTVAALQPAFQSTYLGADSSRTNERTNPGDFAGAIPLDSARFSYLEVDTTKLLAAWGTGIPNVGFYFLSNVFNGFYAYDSRTDSIDFEGRSAVVFQYDYNRNDTGTFRTAVASFPLYRIRVDGSGEPLAATMRAVLDSLER